MACHGRPRMRNGKRRDRATQALTDLLSRRHIGIRQQDRECLAPIVGDPVAVALYVLGETFRDSDQALVTLELADRSLKS